MTPQNESERQSSPNPSMATKSSRLPSKETWAAHGRRWKFLLLLLPGFYTASMDLTVVATAQPFIASHFRKLSLTVLLYILTMSQRR
jgi:hypothetical protein